ncbi:MAG TPA: fumarate hydratase [Pricia sp.]|nr:fumarate hydratase [Pricia sp.]
MKKAVISGDIVAFTGLSKANRELVENHLRRLFEALQSVFGGYGRLVKGDYLEYVPQDPEVALRMALLIKSRVKSIPVQTDANNDSRIKYFENYGIRLAIGYGALERLDINKGIIDGEAVYMSGRKINEEDTHSSDRISIKNTLFFVSKDEALNTNMEALFGLIDLLMNKATSKQCSVLYYKLLGWNEAAISKKLEISQPVVNQHSTSAGWNAIEKAVQYFEGILKPQNTA